MKKSEIHAILILLVFIVFIALGSCDIPGGPVTIEERINMFEAEINKQDRSQVYTHFHPTATVQYDDIKDPEYFDAGPLPYDYEPFFITPVGEPKDEGSGLMSVTADFRNDNGEYPGSATFVMQTGGDNDDWYIKTFTLDISEEDLFEIKRLK